MEEPLTFADVKPARPEAETLATAIMALLSAEKELADAQGRVPSYTGPLRREDYYAEEQEKRNRAADALLAAMPHKAPQRFGPQLGPR